MKRVLFMFILGLFLFSCASLKENKRISTAKHLQTVNVRLTMFDENAIVKGRCSGILINSYEGYILTAKHCVSKEDKFFLAKSPRFKSVEIKPVFLSKKYDIAVLKVLDKNIQRVRGLKVPHINFDKAPVGSSGVYVGSPFNLDAYVAFGTICAYLPDGLGLIDARTTFGNSGGGLYNSNGELIGINFGFMTEKLAKYEMNFEIDLVTMKPKVLYDRANVVSLFTPLGLEKEELKKFLP
jgi:serine protease Do